MKKSPDPGFRTVRGYQLKHQREGGLTPAMEDYLEMAYRLCLADQYVRVGTLSEILQVKPSSASKMILKLVELGYLAYDRYDSILLTGSGRTLGAYLLERHDTVERFLTMIGSTRPLEEAELIEHSLSAQTVAELKTLLSFFSEHPEIKARYQAFAKPPPKSPP